MNIETSLLSRHLKILFACVLILFCLPAQAVTLVSSGVVSVIKIGTYPEVQGGAVLVTVSKAVEGCEAGYWVSGDTPGLDRTLSTFLSAKHTDSLVAISADKERLLPGTGAKYCHVYLLWQV